MRIDIAKDFSKIPGGRKIEEGEYSGELFRDSILVPKYQQACDRGEILEINFDGTFGYSPSFLDESFGGLVKLRREHGIIDNLKIISNDYMSVERKIRDYMKDAEKEIFGE